MKTKCIMGRAPMKCTYIGALHRCSPHDTLGIWGSAQRDGGGGWAVIKTSTV